MLSFDVGLPYPPFRGVFQVFFILPPLSSSTHTHTYTHFFDIELEALLNHLPLPSFFSIWYYIRRSSFLFSLLNYQVRGGPEPIILNIFVTRPRFLASRAPIPPPLPSIDRFQPVNLTGYRSYQLPPLPPVATSMSTHDVAFIDYA